MTIFEARDTAEFMRELLVRESFDRLVLIEASVATAFTTDINGSLIKEFVQDAEADNLRSIEKFVLYSQVRPMLYGLIKGDKPPISFKIILGMSAEGLNAFADRHKDELSELPLGLFINIRYENSKLSIISGASTTGLDLEKNIDRLWDDYLTKLFTKKNLIK